MKRRLWHQSSPPASLQEVVPQFRSLFFYIENREQCFYSLQHISIETFICHLLIFCYLVCLFEFYQMRSCCTSYVFSTSAIGMEPMSSGECSSLAVPPATSLERLVTIFSNKRLLKLWGLTHALRTKEQQHSGVNNQTGIYWTFHTLLHAIRITTPMCARQIKEVRLT